MRSEVEEDTQAMNSECMNLEDDEGRNYYSNQPSTSNQLFNTDISGGSCYVFQSSYTESPPSTSSCLFANPEDRAPGRGVDQDQHREQLKDSGLQPRGITTTLGLGKTIGFKM